MRKIPIIIALVAIVLVGVLSSVFIVDERKQALVLQFGEVKREIRGGLATRAEVEAEKEAEDVAQDNETLAEVAEQREEITYESGPGLYFKIPIIQDVVFYEDRILALDTAPLEVTPIDDRRLVVDAFARWRIRDPVLFRQAVQTEFQAQPRLESILNAALRQVLGSVPSDAVLSSERTELMRRITDVVREEALNLGVLMIDVRIKRADLPTENLEATYRRMNAEREREAADERARGQERAQEVRATAEREAVEIVSDAQRQSEEIRGLADGERNRIYAEAFGQDAEFFAFYRSLTAYERSLQGRNSTMVISPDSEFFEYLKSDGRVGSVVEGGNTGNDPLPGASSAATLPSIGGDGTSSDAPEGTGGGTAEPPADEAESVPEAPATPEQSSDAGTTVEQGVEQTAEAATTVTDAVTGAVTEAATDADAGTLADPAPAEGVTAN